jgi:Domain of unknown function (DUF4743)
MLHQRWPKCWPQGVQLTPETSTHTLLLKEYRTTGIQLLSVQESVPTFTLSNEQISLSPYLSTASLEERTDAVSNKLESLRDAGIIDGWRDELYAVACRSVGKNCRTIMESRVVSGLC